MADKIIYPVEWEYAGNIYTIDVRERRNHDGWTGDWAGYPTHSIIGYTISDKDGKELLSTLNPSVRVAKRIFKHKYGRTLKMPEHKPKFSRRELSDRSNAKERSKVRATRQVQKMKYEDRDNSFDESIALEVSMLSLLALEKADPATRRKYYQDKIFAKNFKKQFEDKARQTVVSREHGSSEFDNQRYDLIRSK